MAFMSDLAWRRVQKVGDVRRQQEAEDQPPVGDHRAVPQHGKIGLAGGPGDSSHPALLVMVQVTSCAPV